MGTLEMVFVTLYSAMAWSTESEIRWSTVAFDRLPQAGFILDIEKTTVVGNPASSPTFGYVLGLPPGPDRAAML